MRITIPRCAFWRGALLSLSFIFPPTILCEIQTTAQITLFTAGSDGGQLLNGNSEISNRTGAAVLSIYEQGTDIQTLPPGCLWMSSSMAGAGCISFNFSVNATVDVFLTRKADLRSMLDDQQASFNGSQAKPIQGTAFKAASSGQMLISVSDSDEYALVAINTDASTLANATMLYFLGAYPPQSTVCRSALDIGLSSVLPPKSDTHFAFEGKFLPGDLSGIALIANATCAAYQLLGQESVSQMQNVSLYITQSFPLVRYVDDLFSGINNGVPAPLGPSCQQSEPPNNNATTPGAPTTATITNGVSPLQDDQYRGIGNDVHLTATQSCQMVNDRLDPSQQYYLLLFSDAPFSNFSATTGTLYPSKVRIAIRSEGSCSDIRFPPTLNTTAIILDEIEGGHNLVFTGVNIDSAVVAAPPGTHSLSGGAIAGIVVGALAGCALLAGLAFFAYRRRQRRRPAAPGSTNVAFKLGEQGSSASEFNSGSSMPPPSGFHRGPPSSASIGPPAGFTRAPSTGGGGGNLVTVSSNALGKEAWERYVHAKQNQQILPQQAQGAADTLTVLRPPAPSDASSVGSPRSPQRDWEWDPTDVEYVTRPDGSAVTLGSGIFGKVHKAKVCRTNVVACKELHGVHSPEEQELLAADISLLASYRHPNIVQLLGACFKDSKCLLIMEYLDGGTLREVRQQPGSLTVWRHRGADMAIDIARGLHYLHWRNATHRNLHSGNVLFSYGGTAKLSDVAFWEARDAQWSGLQQQRSWDTAWRPPELLKGEPYIEASDIFGLGGCLYEILTGHDFAERSKRPIRCPEDCPQSVKDLVVSCIAERPEQRPTAQELVENLQILRDKTLQEQA